MIYLLYSGLSACKPAGQKQISIDGPHRVLTFNATAKTPTAKTPSSDPGAGGAFREIHVERVRCHPGGLWGTLLVKLEVALPLLVFKGSQGRDTQNLF